MRYTVSRRLAEGDLIIWDDHIYPYHRPHSQKYCWPVIIHSGFADPPANSYDKQYIQFLQDSVMAIKRECKTLTLANSKK